MRFGIPLLALAAGLLASASAQTNDNFAGRLMLSGSPAAAVSNNLQATKESGEPNHAANAAGRSLWWTWTAPTSGVFNFSAFQGGVGLTPPRALAIYSGDTVASLTEVGSSNNFDAYMYAYHYQPSSLAATGATVNLSATAGTTYQIAVDAIANPSTSVDDGTVVLTVNAPPTIVSAASVNASTNTSFVYTIVASGGATTYGAMDLPPGLSLNPANGQITGSPTANGSYAVGLSASGPGGVGTATLTIQVSDPVPAPSSPPYITGAASVNGYVGVAFSYSVGAPNSPITITATDLPPGLSFSASGSGSITGTPTMAGTFFVPVTETNADGACSATITIHIDSAPPPPVISSPIAASGTVGSSAFSYAITTNGDSTASIAPTSYAADGLPPGLTLSTAGKITGTPTAAGVYPVSISAANVGGTRSGVVTVTINAAATTPTSPTAAPQFYSAASAIAAVGVAFTYRLTAFNGPTSFTVSNLPPGLSFNASTATITGTPTAAGVFLAPVSATNAYGVSTATLTIDVATGANVQNARLGYPPPQITSAAMVGGYMGQPLTHQVTASYSGSNFGSSVTWTYSATGLPPGLSLASASGASGNVNISGTPTAAGTYPANVTVTYPATTSPVRPAASVTAVVTFIINAAPVSVPPVITGAAFAQGAVGIAFTYSPYATNAPTGYAANGLPPGLSINAATGAITGTPTTAGNYPAALSATNGSGTSQATVTISVGPRPAPLITSNAVSAGTVGTAFNYAIAATSTPISAYAATNLPPGLSCNASTGAISGTPTAGGVYLVTISATNVTGTGSATLTLTISDPSGNTPLISGYACARGTVGTSFSSYTISASNSPTSFSASNLPPGLSVNPTTGAITGTPTTAGIYTVPISASNANGTGAAKLTFSIAPGPLPVFTNGGAVNTVPVNVFWGIYLSATNSPTSFSASNLPPGFTLNPATGVISGTATALGRYDVPVSATNAYGTCNATMSIRIVPPYVYSAPAISSAAGAAGTVGGPFSYAIQASNYPTSYGYTGGSLPPGLSFNPSTGILSGTPSTAGNYNLGITATNSSGTDSAALSIAVAAAPTAPPLITSSAVLIALLRQPFFHRLNVSGPVTAYSASGLPAGLSFDAASGVISGTPTSVGVYTVPVTATNSLGQSQATLTITASNPPFGIFTQAAAVKATVGQPFTFALTASSVSVSSYSASSLPAGLSLNASTGMISGTPTAAGNFAVPISCYSNEHGYISGKLLISIGAASGVPVISNSAGAGGYTGQAFFFYLQATNAPTRFSATTLPYGMTLNPDTGLISGTPTYSQSYPVSVTAYNASGASATATLTITTGSSSNAPAAVTSAASANGVVGSPLTYAVTGNASSYYSITASNLPPGLSLSSYNGQISGTPMTAGRYATTLTFNNSYSVSTPAVVTFNITAQPTDAPVVASPAAGAGIVGYSFRYTVAASNGPTSLSASGLPAGLSFNAATGVISGTPTAAGTFSVALTAANVVGTGSAVLTLTVLAVPPAPPTLTTGSNGLMVGLSAGDSANTYVFAENDPLSYSASGLPPGLSINAATGRITGTPMAAGTFPAAITASNPVGSDRMTVTFVVTPDLPAYVYLAATAAGYVGVAYDSLNVSATHNPTSYAASGLPPGLSVNPTTGSITGTPTAAGRYEVTLSATNGIGTGSAITTIIINDASTYETILQTTAAAAAGKVGVSLSYSFSASTYAGSSYVSVPLTWTVSGLPSGVSSVVSGNSFYLQGAPTQVGVYPVSATATNPAGTAISEVVTFVISTAPPYVTGPANVAGNAGSALASYYLSTNTAISAYSVSGLPPGLTLSSGGQISGTPTAAGIYPATFTATGVGGTTQFVETFLISPPAFGGLPLITSPATVNYSPSGSYGIAPVLSYGSPVYAISAINGPASFGASNLPAGLSINPATGIISGQPPNAGVFRVPISAANASGTCNATVTIVVTFTFPTITAPLTVNGNVGTAFSYPIQNSVTLSTASLYTYASSDLVNYAAAGLPPGLNLNTLTGSITGTPTQAGTYPATLTTTNRAGVSSAVISFVIGAGPAVPVNPPSFTGKSMAWGFVGLPLSYTLTASGSATSYAASNLPAGLSLNAATGQITGLPGAAGTYSVPVSATNAVGTSQAILTVAVDAAPQVPAFSNYAGNNARIGSPYSYYIRAAAVTGLSAATAYQASNLPAGLTFDAAKGLISGAPAGPTGTFQIPIALSVGNVGCNGILTLAILPASTPTAPVLAAPAGTLGFLANPLAYALGDLRYGPAAALPAGLGYDPAAAMIAGFPVATGSRQIALSASGLGNIYAARINLNILAPDLSLPRLLSQPTSAAASVNGSASFAVEALGVPLPTYQWAHNGTPILGATSSTLTLSPVQAADAGAYTVTVANSSGQITSVPALLVVQQSYANWQAAHFTNAEIAAGLANDTADFNGDGINNLLAYALGIDPRTGAGGSLPTAACLTSEDALQFTFIRDAANSDLNYTVEASTDMSQWTPVASSLAGAPATNLGGALSVTEQGVSGTSRVRVVVKRGPLSGMYPRQFLRLRVTNP